jgi:hypothetical protein
VGDPRALESCAFFVGRLFLLWASFSPSEVL